jgi:excisionase family DNA binding protein
MQFDVDRLIDAIADRIVEKLGVKHNGASAGARLLTVEQAAEYIGRTKPGMDHLIAAGKIPTVRSDRRVMIDVRDLDKWIEDNKTT